MPKDESYNYIVDRFEGDYAVLEYAESMETVTRPRTELPEDTREGDVLVMQDGVLRVDRERTAARAANIRARFERLKHRQ